MCGFNGCFHGAELPAYNIVLINVLLWRVWEALLPLRHHALLIMGVLHECRSSMFCEHDFQHFAGYLYCLGYCVLLVLQVRKRRPRSLTCAHAKYEIFNVVQTFDDVHGVTDDAPLHLIGIAAIAATYTRIPSEKFSPVLQSQIYLWLNGQIPMIYIRVSIPFMTMMTREALFIFCRYMLSFHICAYFCGNLILRIAGIMLSDNTTSSSQDDLLGCKLENRLTRT